MRTHSQRLTVPDPIEDQDSQLPRVRVLVVDDNPAILNHVTDILQTDYQIIGKVNDGNSVCKEVERLKPDLIILDISLGARSGIEVARHLREQGYVGEIVFLTVHEDPEFTSAAIGAGGRGYVIKSRMNVDLKTAIKAVLSHRIFVSPFVKDE